MKHSKAPLAYIRVSSSEQSNQGTSVQSQIEIIDQYASNHQYQIGPDDLYQETGSGLRPNQLTRAGALRSVVQRAVEEQRPIIVTRIDRLTRSQDVLDEVFDAGVTIIEAQFNDTISRERAISYLNRSALEREQKRVSQQKAYDRKRARGEPMGNPDIDNVRKKGTEAIKNKAEQFMIDTMPFIEPLLAQDMNPNQIAKELNKQGVPTSRGAPWSRNAVVKILERYEQAQAVDQQENQTRMLSPEDYADHPNYGVFS